MGAEPKPIPRRTVEALLRPEVVVLTPELAGRLRELGVDPERLEAKYSVTQLRAAMNAVREATLADRPVEDGYRELGRRFVIGFKQTPVGWIFSAMAPLFGPDLTMQTLPRYLTSVHDDFPITVIAEGDHRYRFMYRVPSQQPAFIAGCVEVVLETCGVATYEVTWLPHDSGFELLVRWPRP